MDAWLAYAPVKNNPEDAAKVSKGNPYYSATSGEMFVYRANNLIRRKAGVKVADPVTATFNGQEVELWPCITWKHKWPMTFAEVKVVGHVHNKGWLLRQVDHKDTSIPGEIRIIRGFRINKVEQLELNYNEPGKSSNSS
ncbi:hypothetical protein MKX01_036992 [Papaver californicum]|nr:hypothetical protein MKX01_036992 [Papaver californicum]